jgi:hypothetical protein
MPDLVNINNDNAHEVNFTKQSFRVFVLTYISRFTFTMDSNWCSSAPEADAMSLDHAAKAFNAFVSATYICWFPNNIPIA